MENLYVWLFLFAGATIALLGMLLLASERELKKKRRELKQAESNCIVDLRDEVHDSGADSAAELMRKNGELLEEVASLSTRLEESQKAVAELRTEHLSLVTAQSEAEQLEQTIVNLRTQLEASEGRLSESAGRAQEVDDCNSKLKNQVGELTQQLQTSQKTIAELQTGQERLLLDTQSENQKLCAENQQLQQDIGNLKNQLQSSETLVATSAGRCAELTDRYSQLQSDVAELRKQLDEVMIKNTDLSEENNSLSSKLAASQRTGEEIQAIKDATQSENEQLQGAIREFQREIADLKIQLQTSDSRLSDLSRQAQDMADRNSNLQAEAAELKEQLQSSQTTIEELQIEQQRLSGVYSENQRLQQEMVDLRDDLQRSEGRLGDSNRQNQEAADRYALLQGQVSGLQQELEETESKLRELASLEQQLANAESREASYKDRQHDLEAQVGELQRELSDESGKSQELDMARRRLAEIEHANQELHDENRRLVDEISQWQERFARSKGDEAAPPQLTESHIEPAPLIEKSAGESWPTASHPDLLSRAQSTTNGGGELTRESIEVAAAHPVDPIRFGTEIYSPINGSSKDNDHDARLGSDGPQTAMAAPTVRARKRKGRMAIIAAVVALAVAGGVGMGILGTKYFRPMETAVAPETDKEWAPAETVSQRAEIKPALAQQGKFKITQPTEVYSGPSENSELITRIQPGIKINVVGSHNGWLEIRSKHGRPPGFVRQEAAVKIDQN